MNIYWTKPDIKILLGLPLSAIDHPEVQNIFPDVSDYAVNLENLNIPRLPEGNIYRVIISYPSQEQNEEEGGDYLYCRVDNDVYLWKDVHKDSD